MNAPQFQLAVQIPTTFIGSRITEGELEDKVHAAIFGLGKFDGITSDEAETDVFVSTNDPQRVFRHLKPYFEASGIIDQIQAAYRRTDASDYTVIWPAPPEEESSMLM
ncbi:MAG: hypothetical protein RL088_837 [Verrucomicrobiota bacterium]|jgi:hypothetical protein